MAAFVKVKGATESGVDTSYTPEGDIMGDIAGPAEPEDDLPKPRKTISREERRLRTKEKKRIKKQKARRNR